MLDHARAGFDNTSGIEAGADEETTAHAGALADTGTRAGRDVGRARRMRLAGRDAGRPAFGSC